jgi:hypothetical protein
MQTLRAAVLLRALTTRVHHHNAACFPEQAVEAAGFDAVRVARVASYPDAVWAVADASAARNEIAAEAEQTVAPCHLFRHHSRAIPVQASPKYLG